MKHLDLFSGIGGFALAAEWIGWETVGFCEVDPFCREVIERRFDSVRWISVPGHFTGWQTLGLEGDQELVGFCPDWIVIENSGHRWRSWVPELRRRLHRLGYASLPLRLLASEIGAIHRRSRVYLIANPNSEQLRELSRWWSGTGREMATQLAKSWDSAPRGLGTNDELPDWVDRRKALGNAVLPACAFLVFAGIQEVMARA